MRMVAKSLELTVTHLVGFLNCRYLSYLDLAVAEGMAEAPDNAGGTGRRWQPSGRYLPRRHIPVPTSVAMARAHLPIRTSIDWPGLRGILPLDSVPPV